VSNVITIDGPTSSGKSSVGYYFSQKIGYQFIDTGAIYRAGSLELLKQHISPDDVSKVVEIFKGLVLEFRPAESKQRIILAGEDVTDKLHSPEVTQVVPIIAAKKEVREVAKEIQKKIGNENNTVMTGRDIGSEIFPDAKLKFFISASAEVRAKRRFDQLKKVKPEITYQEVLNQMLDRDKQDTEREASPMRIPKGAIEVDTSNRTIEESVGILYEYYKDVFGEVE
jgi:cytidylate kinase